ncbi:MAG: L,D-transpeptidase [Gammaproteobacteria bacterium]|nr:L,D-transpeptidase [Gammaproteobacteria bacterium]
MTRQVKLQIDVACQQMTVLDDQGNILKQYPVSTSRYGTGSEHGSFKTPLGQHCIKEKIGDGEPVNQVFVGRQAIGVLGELDAENLPEDIITSRILRLEGQDKGVNQGGTVDSYQRYIYIHGTDEENKIGTPASHGCIRMRNKDVIELFDLVEPGCPVIIE